LSSSRADATFHPTEHVALTKSRKSYRATCMAPATVSSSPTGLRHLERLAPDPPAVGQVDVEVVHRLGRHLLGHREPPMTCGSLLRILIGDRGFAVAEIFSTGMRRNPPVGQAVQGHGLAGIPHPYPVTDARIRSGYRAPDHIGQGQRDPIHRRIWIDDRPWP
jgi:hypothetical protein